MKNYSETLNLPKTNFSMKADLANNEEKYIDRWDAEKVYENSLRENAQEFIMHDGPPYANGDIHLGTAFNKILKDVVVKYKRLKGYKAKFIPGWDTHGLPIELAVVKKLGKGILANESVSQLRKRFREHAEIYIDKQRKDFKRLGILADWYNPYITMDAKFESKQLEVFANLVDNGYVYNALKPVYWCTETRTALAESEVVYKEHISDSIYFKCKADKTLENKLGVDSLYFAIWTTTPWTLPANLAIALNKDLEYSIVSNGKDNLILGSDLVDSLRDKLGIKSVSKAKYKGSFFEYSEYFHPFLDKKNIVVLGDHVTATSGTGCVHTAPGHGTEDYIVGKKYNLEILCPVDEQGCMMVDGVLKGLFYKDANGVIISNLMKNHILCYEKVEHSYPYSDRGHAPIIFRATRQWFIRVDGKLRDRALAEIEKINFYPDYGMNRLNAMIGNRPDWCISRQRVWGVPIPVFYCVNCERALLNSNLIREIAKEVYTKGTDVFVESDPEHFLKGRYMCCNDNKYKQGKDIFDVWFDSGVSYEAVLDGMVSDLYLEGSDQHRGWFQTSLLTSVGSRDRAPFKNIMTHGFVVDGNGMKMSKSLGNVISPQEITAKYGADILRLWAVYVDFSGDVKISDDILKQNVENYRKIRNSFRFMLGNLYTDVNKDKSETETKTKGLTNISLLEIDKLALNRLHKLISTVDELFKVYQFHNGITEIINFVTEMSAFYLDIIKDRLYTEHITSAARISAQVVLKEIAVSLSKMLSPVLSFTMEEIWDNLHTCNSIHVSNWPESAEDKKLSDKWDNLLAVRDVVNRAAESEINSGSIKRTQEAMLELQTNADLSELDLKELFKVAEVKLEKFNTTTASIKPYNGLKCERCWLYYRTLEDDVCSKCKDVLSR